MGLALLLVAGWLLWVELRPPPEGFAPVTGRARATTSASPDLLQYTIDARSRQDWVFFSFSRGMAVTSSMDALNWDIAFRRTDNLTNGGETNPQGLGGAVDLGDVALAEASAPRDGYEADATHEERGLENPALHKWYNYNWTSHTISSKDRTYAVRTAQGDLVLLSFVSYYCDDGSSGCVTFRYLYPVEP